MNAHQVNNYIAKVRIVHLSAYEGNGENSTYSFFPLLAERSVTEGFFCEKLPLASCFLISPLYTKEKNGFTACSFIRLLSFNFSLKAEQRETDLSETPATFTADLPEFSQKAQKHGKSNLPDAVCVTSRLYDWFVGWAVY